MKIACFTAMLLLLMLTTDTAADSPYEDYLWDNPEKVQVSDRNVAFSHTKYDHPKNESIFVMVYFNDGWVLMYNLFHIDMTLFDRWGMYALIAGPDGTSYWKTATADESDIEISEDHLYYNDGVNLIEEINGKLYLRCDFEGFSCDLVFDKYMPSWKPGTGREEYTEDGEYFQYKAVFVPRADVRGRLEVDGISVSVTGNGYGEKTLFVNPWTRHQPYLHALRLYSPIETPRAESWHIGIHEVVLNEHYGHRELPRLVVARGDEWMFTTRDYVFEPVETTELDTISHPYGTEFLLRGGKNGYVLNGVVRERVFFHFTDVFETLPMWVRKLLSVFFKRPVYFRYVAEFSGTVTTPDGSEYPVELSGPYEYVVVY